MNSVGRKIVYLCTNLDWGGTEGNAVELARGCVRRGIPVAILVDRPPLHRAPALDAAGISYEVLGVEESWTEKRYQTVLTEALKRHQASVLHAQVWERQRVIFQAANAIKLPVVFTIHSTVRATLRHRLGIVGDPKAHWQNYWLFTRQKPIVINISELSEASFRTLYPQVPHSRCVYVGAYVPPLPNNASEGGCAPQVLWIGSMIARKRPLEALAVWENVLKKYPQARLVMIGAGPLMSEVEKKVAALPPGAVTLAGSVFDLSDYLGSSQITLHTAAQEGTPKNIIYSNTFGFPTAALDVGAISELVHHTQTGLLAPKNDFSLLERYLCELIGNPEQRGIMGNAARLLGESRFNLERHIDETLRVYRDFGGIAFDEQAPDKPYRPETLT